MQETPFKTREKRMKHFKTNEPRHLSYTLASYEISKNTLNSCFYELESTNLKIRY